MRKYSHKAAENVPKIFVYLFMIGLVFYISKCKNDLFEMRYQNFYSFGGIIDGELQKSRNGFIMRCDSLECAVLSPNCSVDLYNFSLGDRIEKKQESSSFTIIKRNGKRLICDSKFTKNFR
jgi:hypothetical protein